jgi:hypothetical protein
VSLRAGQSRPVGVGGAVAICGAVGMALVVIGTFLPWLRSGRRLRNSYQADGAIRRLLEPQGPAHFVLSVWPAISIACAVAVALYALGARTVALTLGLLIGLGVAAVAIGALSAPRVHAASVVPPGPVVTLIGAASVLAAVSIRFASFVRDDRRYR